MPTTDQPAELLLVPTPRSITTGSGTLRVGQDWSPARIERRPLAGARGPEHYELRVSPSGIVILSASPAGERAALATLGQLRRQFGGELPEVTIEDWPAFAVRGVMLDVSRDRIPRMDEFPRLLDVLASLKFNHLQLYTEHTFAYPGHEAAWIGFSPITPDQIATLREWCASRGIELAANQNCFGHLGHWLRQPPYRHLAETHGDWMFDDAWPKSGPFSVCPTDPASEAFIGELLKLLLPHFDSPLVNIGCDETFDVGFGRSKAEVERRGRPAVYLEFVTKIASRVRSLGKRPMFWADIALTHPETLGTLPKDLVALAWGYEPDAPFDRWCRVLQGAGLETWVCPGTSTWRTLTGRTTERHGNLDAAAKAGVAAGVPAMLVCDWGDTGHWQTWPITAHALAHGAHAAWTGSARGFSARAAAVHALGVSAEHADLGLWLEELGDADLALRETCLPLSRPPKPGEPPRLRNQTALMIDLFKAPDEQTDIGAEWDWFNAHQNIQRLKDQYEERFAGRLPGLIDDELTHTLDMAAFAAVRGWVRRLPAEDRPISRGELLAWIDDLVEEHRRLWCVRSRSGGLAHSCGFWDEVRQKTAQQSSPQGSRQRPAR